MFLPRETFLVFLVLLAATTTLCSSLNSASAEPLSTPPDNSQATELAARAAEAFRSGKHRESLALYQKASKLAEAPGDRAAIQMNVAACLIELGQLGDAKEQLLEAARTDPSASTRARLNAALVATELGQLNEAEALLAAASPVDASLRSREQDVRERIASGRKQVARSSLLSLMNKASKALGDGQAKLALASLEEALRSSSFASNQERVDVLHAMASAQLSLGRPSDARNTAEEAVRIAPDDPELHYLLARANQQQGATVEALAEYRAALTLGLREPQAKYARQRIRGLDPLSESEWSGWLSLGAGFDSNPRQSGIATETTLGRRGRGGTGYGHASAEIGRSQRVHDNVALRMRYTGDWLGLQKSTVRDLSMQTHSGFIGMQWSPMPNFDINLDVGPSATYLGLTDLGLFASDLSASVKTRYRASTIRTWRGSFDARVIQGSSEWKFLSGTRLDAEVTHQWQYSVASVRLGLRGRHLTIGTRETMVDATVMPVCVGTCDGALYVIPLSYSSLGPAVSGRFALADSLHLGASAQLDYRRYRALSYIMGTDASRKRRIDLRYGLGTDLTWELDEHGHFALVPSYALLISSSNVAQSGSDPSHLYDYDDRNFVQHFAELAFEANF